MTTDIPHQRHSDTSTAAAEAIEPVVGRLQIQVWNYLRRRGETGATDEEMQLALFMGQNTQRPRRVELVAAGAVRDSGHRRKTRSGRKAVVWVAV